MRKYDASIVLNLHREGPFLERTLISLDHAVKLARNEGHSIELVVVLDRADDLTKKVMQEHDCSVYSELKIIEVDNGSLGLSRNDGIAVCEGEYIYTADGDDLISENYFLDFINFYKNETDLTLYFPEYLLGFGDDYFYTKYHDLADITPFAFIESHPYISRVCAHHTVFNIIKYQDTRLHDGYAYEDWHFNCEAIAHGFDIKTVPDTIIFYRQRSGSLLRQSNSISAKQIPPSKLFTPEIYVKICEKYLSTQSSAIQKKIDTPSLRPTKKISSFIEKANKIEKSISIDKYNNILKYDNLRISTDSGRSYYDICQLIDNNKFDDIFLFPFISKGGAEKYIFEIIKSINRQFNDRNILIIIGEGDKFVSSKEHLPENVTCIDLHLYASFLSMEDKLILTIKLIQSVGAQARIHYRQSIFGDKFLKKYGKLFSENHQTYYRFIKSSPLDNISENIENLNLIITDNQNLVDHDIQQVGNARNKWKFLPAPIEISSITSEKRTPNNILWASRLDKQKRPKLITKIYDRISENNEINFDVYGDSVFGEFSPDQFGNNKNLKYKGSFNGLNSLNLQDYGIFLYTSYYDGLPNILLEAMAAGLLVIAPNVGGISEIVKHKETGYLIEHTDNDDQMADRYAAAIKEILAHPEQIEELTNNATKLLQERHSYERYDQHIRELFGSNNSEAQKERELNNFDITDPETANALLIERLTRQRNIANYEAQAASRMLHANPKDFLSYGMINNSKAFRLAELYTRTAHGPNFAVKFWRFGRALYPVAKRMAKRKLFNR